VFVNTRSKGCPPLDRYPKRLRWFTAAYEYLIDCNNIRPITISSTEYTRARVCTFTSTPCTLRLSPIYTKRPRRDSRRQSWGFHMTQYNLHAYYARLTAGATCQPPRDPSRRKPFPSRESLHAACGFPSTIVDHTRALCRVHPRPPVRRKTHKRPFYYYYYFFVFKNVFARQ
jgi:hypothetical protein